MKKEFIIIFIVLFFPIVFADYYSENEYLSGSNIKIGENSYTILVGNNGQKVRIENESFAENLELNSCKRFEKIDVCHIENVSDSRAKISQFIHHGVLEVEFSKSHSGFVDLYYGQNLEFNFTFENTGNLTVEPYFEHFLDDKLNLVECDNCELYFDKVVFNKSIEPSEEEIFSYKITPQKFFNLEDFTPTLIYFNSYEGREVELEEVRIEGKKTFDFDVFVNISEVELGEDFELLVFLNNSWEIDDELNYSIEVEYDSDDFLYIDSTKFRKTKTDSYKIQGKLMNENFIRQSIFFKTFKENNKKINLTLRVENLKEKIDYSKKFQYEIPVVFSKKPEAIFRVPEILINNSNQKLLIFLQNNANINLQNISANFSSSFLNTSFNYSLVEGISEIAQINLPTDIYGDNIFKVNISYYTQFGEKHFFLEEMIIDFGEPKKVIEKVVLNKTLENDSLNKTDELNETLEIIEENTIQEDTNFYWVAILVIFIIMFVFIYEKFIKVKLLSIKEKKLLENIQKIKDEIQKKEGDL